MNRSFTTVALLLISYSTFASASDDCFSRWESAFDNSDINYSYYKMIGSCDFDLRSTLHDQVMANHEGQRYGDAAKQMYKYMDVHNNKLCSVYSPSECNVQGEPKEFRINCEHTWPKSKGAKQYPAVSDLHHLYPSEKDINSKRANLPFCNVKKVFWEHGGSKMGLGNAPTECFEPPQDHKGNVARSMFYFATRYGLFIDAAQESVLRQWHKEDPVDRNDIRRNNMIEEYQGNRNPFIDQPYLVDLISDF